MKLLVKKKFWLIAWVLNILVATALLSGCQKKSLPELSQQEREKIEPIFNYILFQHPGVFVLFGSKPMSACSLPSRESFTEEELQRALLRK